MRLIPEWRSAIKFLSVQANIIGMALAGAYASMYDQLKVDLPPKHMAMITVAVFAGGILCRIISQQPKAPDEAA